LYLGAELADALDIALAQWAKKKDIKLQHLVSECWVKVK